MESPIFQQNNAPCHKFEKILEYLSQNSVEIIKCLHITSIERIKLIVIKKMNSQSKNKKID